MLLVAAAGNDRANSDRRGYYPADYDLPNVLSVASVDADGRLLPSSNYGPRTVALAAHYAAPLMVVIGTTLGMLIADVPAVFVGDRLASRIPMKLVHSVAAAIFALLGSATLLGAGSGLGF